MGRFVKGDVVVVPFPFSDLSRAKRRPALVVAELEGDDRILCQITSQKLHDKYSIVLRDADFESGGLKRESRIRPNRLFTADIRLILYPAGHLKPEKLQKVIEQIIEILRS
jgi:mRNA interferase MazF